MTTMTSLSVIIYISAIILHISKLINTKDETQWQSHKLISKDGWTRKAEDFNNPTMVYSMCKDELLNNTSYECTIILQKDFQEDASKSTQCEFTLDQASNGIIRVKSFAGDKVIFVWSHQLISLSLMRRSNIQMWKFKMAVMDMSNCQIHDTGLILENDVLKNWDYDDDIWHAFHIDILTHDDDTFDVIVQGIKACENATDDSHCVYTYDSYGKKIKGPVTLFSPLCDEGSHYVFRPNPDRLSGKNYLVNGGAQTHQRVFMIKPTEKPDGEVITKLLWKSPENKDVLAQFSHGWNNKMIVLCTCKTLPQIEITCNCLQSDEKGNSKRPIKFTLKQESNAISLMSMIHSFREGGFFVVSFFTDNEKHFYAISEVKSDGQVVKELSVIGTHSRACSAEFANIRFIEQDDDRYCLTLACIEKSENNLKTLTKCYTSKSLN